MNFVHRRGGIGNRTYLVGIKFLPPIKGCGNVHRNEDLAKEFAVVAARVRKALCKIQVVWTKHVAPVAVVGAIHTRPAVHRVARAANGIFHIHHRGAFDFQHVTDLPF